MFPLFLKKQHSIWKINLNFAQYFHIILYYISFLNLIRFNLNSLISISKTYFFILFHPNLLIKAYFYWFLKYYFDEHSKYSIKSYFIIPFEFNLRLQMSIAIIINLYLYCIKSFHDHYQLNYIYYLINHQKFHFMSLNQFSQLNYFPQYFSYSNQYLCFI